MLSLNLLLIVRWTRDQIKWRLFRILCKEVFIHSIIKDGVGSKGFQNIYAWLRGREGDVLMGSAIFSLKSFLAIYHDLNY